MTDKATSKTAALKAAQEACGRVHRRSATDYVCMVPFYDNNLSGPSTELQADSYPKCRAWRTRKVARIALHLMGAIKTNEDYIAAEGAFETACRWGSVPARALLDAALAELSVTP